MAETTITRPEPLTDARGQLRLHPGVALAALLLIGAVLIFYSGRHLSFFYDEWDFVLGRRGGGVGTYLHPHNGHLVLFSVLVYKVLFKLFGLRHYAPYLAVSVVLHLVSCALLYVLVRRRLGPWLSLVPTALLLFIGSAWQDLLWPFQMSYLASVAGGLGMLVLLEEHGRSRDLAASALLTWSVLSSGVGLAFVVAGAVMMIARRDPWPRLLIAVAPLILYGVWYLGWGTSEHVTLASLLGAPRYDATAASAAAAGVAGLDTGWGPPLLVAFLLVTGVTWQVRKDVPPSPILWSAATGALTFWTLAAIARADVSDPSASRYVYIGAVFLLLLAAETARGGRLPRFGPLIALAGLLMVGAVLSNLDLLRTGGGTLRSLDGHVRAALTAVEVAQPVVSPGFVPDMSEAPQISAGPYLAAVRDLGSPAFSVAQLEGSASSLQVRADGVLLQAERIALTPSAAPLAATCTLPRSGAAITAAVAPGQQLQFAAPAGARVAIAYRRFASVLSPLPDAGAGGVVAFPADRLSVLPWHIQLSSTRPLRACVS